MRDLYKQLGINPSISSKQTISNAIESSNSTLKEDCRAVLLDPSRKAVYDRSHKTAAMIGALRSRMDLKNTYNWGREFSDFNRSVRRNAPKTDSPGFIGSTFYWIAKALGILGKFWIAIVLLFVFLPVIIDALDGPETDSAPTSRVNPGTPSSISPATPSINVPPRKVYSSYYVTADALNMRSGPSGDYPVIEVLPKFETVQATVSNTAGWLEVNKGENRGFVSAAFMEKGIGSVARMVSCRNNAGAPPIHGEVFISSSMGPNALEVKAPGGSDVIVKLKNKRGETILNGYVSSGRTHTFSSIPDGEFQFQYAMGNNYSRSCEVFTDNMRVNRDPEYTPYTSDSTYSTIMTYELVITVNGNFSPSSMRVEDF